MTQDGHSVHSVSCLSLSHTSFFSFPDLLKILFSLLRPVTEGQTSSNSLPTSIMVSLPAAPPPPPLPVAPSPARPNNSLSNRKPGILPTNLEEMKVTRKPYILTLDSKVIALTFSTRLLNVKNCVVKAGKMFFFSITQLQISVQVK